MPYANSAKFTAVKGVQITAAWLSIFRLIIVGFLSLKIMQRFLSFKKGPELESERGPRTLLSFALI